MLGAMVADVLSREPSIALTVTARNPARPGVAGASAALPCITFDAERDPLPDLRAYDWVINAIGIIKPYIKDDDAASTERALRVNALLPHLLAAAAAAAGVRVLQIATDCVYTGRTGMYTETALHDALDVYGKTKSLGEVPGTTMHHLRCSIIGPELQGHVSLLDWFRKQPTGATLTGFVNHRWNGVTTYHYARLCAGIITHGLAVPPRLHVVPTGLVTKAAMLEGFAAAYGRMDLDIRHGEAQTVADRTVQTEHVEINATVWRAAGYATPPTFHEMIAELAAHPFNC